MIGLVLFAHFYATYWNVGPPGDPWNYAFQSQKKARCITRMGDVEVLMLTPDVLKRCSEVGFVVLKAKP